MSRSRRTAFWVAGAVSALALLLAPAPAALADSSPLATGHPGLVAAQAISPTQVLACFDQILATPFAFTDASFFLQGYTESRKSGAPGLALSTKTSAGGGFCVVAAFTGAGDARSYSRLVVLTNAVNASVPGGGGAGNVQSSVALVGSTLPNTTGATLHPQLVGAAASGAAKATFTFNVPLTAAGGTHSFGFYASGDSAFHAGTVSGFTPGTTVGVDFNATDAALLGQATRFVAGEGAVTDAGGQMNPLGTIGGATSLIDLAPTTAQVSGLTYRFDFNKAIPASAAICGAKFALYDAGGARYSPTGVTVSADRLSVAVTFAPDTAGSDPAQITLATVAADAIDATACGGTSLNSDGAAGLPGVTAKAGATSGPDLVSFQVDRSSGNASFVFDAPVSAATIAPSSFHLVDRSAGLTGPPNQGGCLLGPPASGPQFSVNPANTVNVNFSVPTCLLNLLPGTPDTAAARNAVGVTVDEGAVRDATSAVANPLGSFGVPGSPTGPTGPTTPPAPTVPVVTPPKPVTPTKPLTAACKRVVIIHLTSSVSRNLRSATATVNGKPVAVSKKLTITVTFSKYPGAKSIVVKIKGKLKNHKSISRTKTYKSKC